MPEIKLKNQQKVAIVLIAVLFFAVSFGLGTWYGYISRPAIDKVLNVSGKEPTAQYQAVDFDLFWDVWSRVEERYVDKTKINRKDMVNGAIAGLVNSLKDPYTEFMPPVETKQFQQDIKGSFEGIGAEIGLRKGILTVIAPLKGSPAEKAGVLAGDKIIKIDDKSTGDLSLNEAVRLIRGKGGTQVKLTVFRDSLDKTKEISITRDTIKVEAVTTEKKSDGIFVIKISTFTESASYEFRKAVQEFLDSGSKKIVLDLRNDPGGYLNVAVDIASWFMPAGETVVTEKNYDNSEDIYRSSGYRLLEDIPMVVLVNEGSASASEILAGALRDNKNIKLIGTKTFGKGSVQEVENLSGGASLKITIAKWLTPKGTEINKIGLEPDIKVELPKEPPKEGEETKDIIMEKGIEVLKGL